MQVRRTTGDDPAAVALVTAMVDEVGRMYEPGLSRSPTTPADFSPPGGGFLLLLSEDGRVLAGGGVKRLDERACEIKRMYVVPEARGRGLGRELLATLEELARDMGYAVVRLDTGPKQPDAQRMYERAGYVAVPDYNGNPYASFWGEKALGRAAGTDPPAVRGAGAGADASAGDGRP